jgi:ketosteroid isomerase-like protein
MKKLWMILLLVFLMCLNFSCQQPVEETVEKVKSALDVEADIAAIEILTKECSRAWNEGDYEGYMALIDENALFLPPNAYSNSFNSLDFDVTITTEEIHVAGDLAFSRDGWKGSMNPKDGSEPILFDNKTLSIYKRQADGSWKYWRVMYSSNTLPTNQ